MRAMLLVLLNIADCLAETSKNNVELLSRVETLNKQITMGTIKRNMVVRAMDKIMPVMLGAIWAGIFWTWNNITDLQHFKDKIEIQQKLGK